MSSPRHPRITLELEAGADPIRGTIDHPDGTRQRFWGWLELMEVLRRAAAGEPARPSQPSPTDIGPASQPNANQPTATIHNHRGATMKATATELGATPGGQPASVLTTPSRHRGGISMRAKRTIKLALAGVLVAGLVAGPASSALAEPGTESALVAYQGQGAGHVSVEPTGTLVNEVTVNVHDTTPNVTFQLQRAIGHHIDGQCRTSPDWVTDATITASAGGTGSVHFSAHPPVPSGTRIDIVFRVVGDATGLRSDCMTFTVK